MQLVSYVNRHVLVVAVLGLFLPVGCDRDDAPLRHSSGTDSIYVNSIGMQFQYVPAGHFVMGSTTGEDDEQPRREVEITTAFFLATTEVTQQQWEAVMASNPSTFERPNRPVDSVSWYRAQAFVDNLNRKEDTDLYRLPTEAEWEYAVRGGTSTRYYFGESPNPLRDHAWYTVNSEEGTHRVARRLSNPHGLYDVYGNVWEWMEDAYDPTFYRRGARTDPMNPGSLGAPRVIRGGGWDGSATDLRSANRGWARPGVAGSQFGLRILREIPEDER